MDYVLDFIVKSAAFTQDNTPSFPVYFSFETDGSNEKNTTHSYMPTEKIDINFAKRVCLRLKNLSTAHMYISMYIINEAQTSTQYGVSKINLRSFPMGSPANFSFKLLSPHNSAIDICEMVFTATISPVITPATPAQLLPPPTMAIPVKRM